MLTTQSRNLLCKKGEKLLDDVYEANIVSGGKTIATLPKIGYYMLNDQLVMLIMLHKEKVVIPEDFHFLKVVKFNNGDYKLTFCNVLGVSVQWSGRKQLNKQNC
ncbi:MAG: hypothetical protein LBU56_03355 [Rickettsiales bacterium]|jgi:hypothetical protein|nr:hypothetical protein [Rickettsiales bacterium]